MAVRTRFAPSPTGFLHIGGARTALFSWLFARKHGGVFVLRIEDTDLERSTAESVNAILEGMTWLGLDYDEGPFYQTQRFDRYREVIQKLLDEGNAYRCYCSKERLEALRADQMARGEKPRYDALCRNLKGPPPDAPAVVRFKNPMAGVVVIDDMIRGRIAIDNAELDDLIIARSDGTPTYNLTVVVDDWDMGITHVIRGDDHINNTPRQINIIEALDGQRPRYGHVPMIMGTDGKRLSKRHGAVSVMEFREQGVLPEALLNYLVRLGWSHGDREIFTVDQMIELFDVNKVHPSPAAFDPDKLLWYNQHYIKEGDPAHVAHHLSWHMGQQHIDPAAGPDLPGVVTAQRERAKTLVEMAHNSLFFYRDVEAYDEKAAAKHLKPTVHEPLLELRRRLQDLQPWSAAAIHDALVQTAEQNQLKLGGIAQPVRVAVSGGAVSPPIDVTLELLGREQTLKRLDQALEFARCNV